MTTTPFFTWHRSNMDTAIFSIGSWTIKFPYSIGAYREINREWDKIKTARKDPFFQKYLPRYYRLGPALLLPKLKPIEPTSQLVKQFLTNLIDTPASLDSATAAELPELESWNIFIQKHVNSPSYWQKICTNLQIKFSSAHGDCHTGNMLTDGQKLYLIDWSNYHTTSVRIFDFITFHVTTGQKSWTQEIFHFIEMNDVKKQILFDFLIAYCISRTAKELRELANLDRLDTHDINKYRTFLENLKDYLSRHGFAQNFAV